MSHPLNLYKKQYHPGVKLQKPRLAVEVERFGGTKATLKLVTTTAPISLARADAFFAPLPQQVRILSQDNEPITPTWKFWISTETIDPFHLLLDWDGN